MLTLAVNCNWINVDKILKRFFSVQKINFDGNDKVNDTLLTKKLGIRHCKNIFEVDIHDVKKRLEDITWIRSVVVQRKLPDTLDVRVSERVPIAMLQSKYKLYLIDIDGKVLEKDDIGRYNNLSIFSGEGAAKEAARLLMCLNDFNKIKKQLVFAVRIGKRRWDLTISKGVIVKLPENGMRYAIQILEEISDSKGGFNDDIGVIDLRSLDRVVMSMKNEQKSSILRKN